MFCFGIIDDGFLVASLVDCCCLVRYSVATTFDHYDLVWNVPTTVIMDGVMVVFLMVMVDCRFSCDEHFHR